jgi:protein SCO1/2
MSPYRRLSDPGATVLVAIALIVTLALLAGWAPRLAGAAQVGSLEDYQVGSYKIGGDFKLTDQNGKLTGPADWRGEAVLMFFGYTHCADTCPLTLSYFRKALHDLGKDAARVKGVFITIDPERDTPAVIGGYVSKFDPSLVGLTGSRKAIEDVAARYSAVFHKEKETSPAGYAMGHSAFIYLMDRKGRVRYLMPPDVGPALLEAGLRAMLKEK